MEYIITRPQLSAYLKRRFTMDELNEMVSHVKKEIEDGYDEVDAIYETVRHYIALKRLPISDEGSEDEYWYSYLQYETPLVEYIKSSLNLG